MIIDQPTMLPGAFAQNGDKNIIPSNNDGLTGLASIEKGFPPITQQPLASGGLPPQRADFNGIFNWLSLFNVFYQNGGVLAYSEDLDYDVSNFVTDGTDLYKCIKENGAGTDNGVQPLSNATYWDKLLTVGTSANVNYTINDNTVPSDNYGTLISLLSEFANRIKVIGGVNNWYNNPSISLLTLSNLVSNLASGSDVQWSGNQFTNSKLGISGLMAQNGYVKFGPNFGGLIVQWGFSNVNTEILPPLTVATFPLFGTACFYTSQNNLYASTFGYNNGRITIVCEASYSGAQGFWLILCK